MHFSTRVNVMCYISNKNILLWPKGILYYALLCCIFIDLVPSWSLPFVSGVRACCWPSRWLQGSTCRKTANSSMLEPLAKGVYAPKSNSPNMSRLKCKQILTKIIQNQQVLSGKQNCNAFYFYQRKAKVLEVPFSCDMRVLRQVPPLFANDPSNLCVLPGQGLGSGGIWSVVWCNLTTIRHHNEMTVYE